MRKILGNGFSLSGGTAWHILLWSIVALFLIFSPLISYRFLVQSGKPIQVWEQPPEELGEIRYNVEDLKYWAEDMAVYEEGETYALWGWAFLDIDQKIRLADFNRFVVLSNLSSSYVFPTEVYPRPGVQDAFGDLGLDDLASAGFYAVIAKNAVPAGTYSVGLLFTQEHEGEEYFVSTNKVLVRTPNHLKIETQVTR